MDGGASPVSTGLRVRDTNAGAPTVSVFTEEESLALPRRASKRETDSSGFGARANCTLSAGSSTVTGGPFPVTISKSASKPKKQYFGNVRIFNASKGLR